MIITIITFSIITTTMPPKRQRTLPFARAVANRSIRSGGSIASQDLPPAEAPAPSPVPSNASSDAAPLRAPKDKIRTSWVFRHMPDEDMQTKYYNEVSTEEEWRCRYCDKTYLTSGSTSGPSGHLTGYHSMPRDSRRDVKAKNVQVSLQRAFAQGEANPQKRRRLNTEAIDQDMLEALWVRCLVSNNLSFRLVESTEFRAFVKYLNEDAEMLLVKDHKDIRKWVLRQYEGLKKNTIIPILKNAKTKIHISLDLWTSPNSIAILGITAQFINEQGELQSLVLALKEVEGEHSGENMSKYVMEVILDYSFEKNLGYFVMDNALDNDTLLTNISLSLRRDYKLPYDPIHHRLRCQGHIINLAIKSFLFVTDQENIEEDKEINVYVVTLKQIEEWRKKGPLGKLHNFVVWLAASTQRLHNFLDVSHNHRLPRDNSTRWNSWYMMLMTAWNLRDLIDEFFNLYATADLEQDRLTDVEWATIRTIKEFLEKLSMATKACESAQATLDLVLPCTDFVLHCFEQAKKDYENNAIFAPMFNSGWAKMDKYFRLSDKSSANVAALVLHPSKKWRWIERHWHKDWVPTAKLAVNELWEKKYKPISTLSANTSTNTSTKKPPNAFLQWINDDVDEELADEYERYCAMAVILGIKQGYRWWLEETQQKRFPHLSKMALDILSIPAMSADPERLFSGAKITITDRRNRLGITTIQALECLKSWLRISHATDDDIEDGDGITGGLEGDNSSGTAQVREQVIDLG